MARPASVSCCLAGAYRAMYAGNGRFTRGLIRSIGTALLFSLVPQQFKTSPSSAARVFFVDAAPPLVRGGRFTIGIVGRKGCYRNRRCPAWVTSMPQAELYAIYTAAKIAGYEGLGTVCIGGDSDTATQQVLQQRATTNCAVQNRILRRMFWLRLWSGLKVVPFHVACAINPADPMSRLSSFPSRGHAVREAHARTVSWQGCEKPFACIHSLEPPTWSPGLCAPNLAGSAAAAFTSVFLLCYPLAALAAMCQFCAPPSGPHFRARPAMGGAWLAVFFPLPWRCSASCVQPFMHTTRSLPTL